MFIVGLDLGKRKSQMCVTDAAGKIVEERKIETTREALEEEFAKYKRSRVLIEASTSSEWVARALEKIGLEVIVANPRFDLMYAQRDKKVKNDRRDARALAQALRLGAYQAIHRRSDAARKLMTQLMLRNALVSSRTKLINLVRSIAEAQGVTIGSSATGYFAANACEDLENHPELLAEVSPAIAQIGMLSETIKLMDDEFEEQSQANAVTRNLRTMRGIGPLASLTFYAVIDDVKRFDSGRQVSAYLGLVPSENNTGGSKRRPGAITKSGNSLARKYLVEAAFSHTSERAPKSNLKGWRDGLLKRDGRKSKMKAGIAVARRMARILFAMWRDMKSFDDTRTAPVVPAETATNATTDESQGSTSEVASAA